MAEFLNKEMHVVEAGDPIKFDFDWFQGTVYRTRKWTVECVYKTPDGLRSRGEVIEATSYNEAYDKWRQLTWKTLFDPINVKIESINISESER